MNILKFKRITSLLFSAIILFTTNPGLSNEPVLSGKTMGTTYHIKFGSDTTVSALDLKPKIDQKLEEINQSLSTFRSTSEISRFNEYPHPDQRFEISDNFGQVMKVGEKLYILTKGAWDGTMHPIINLWGFGYQKRLNKIPPDKKIKNLLKETGFEYIRQIDTRYLIKTKASVTLDLASIAKGYAVDQLSDIIRKNGYKNFLVEIGGEVYAEGFKSKFKPWRVGINKPHKDAFLNEVYRAVKLENKALATSGDYRNFFEKDGKRYSHIIDPKTGYPVSNGVVSVSIISKTCSFADGLATAIMVMGHKKGLSMVEDLPEVECMIIVEDDKKNLANFISKGFFN